jgi:CheY-like chemotaxis protein/signal transduction histidine kinase/HAMP domain-containing protein
VGRRPASEPDAPDAQAPARRSRRRTKGDGDDSGGNGGSGGSKRPRRGRTRLTAYDLEDLLERLQALQEGDFSARLPESGEPLMVDIARAFNNVAGLNEQLSREVGRISTTVGRQGQMTDRVSLGAVSGGWEGTTDCINSLITDLMQPTTEVARVLTSVARGDLSRKMVLEIDGKTVQGEFLRIGTTVNTMLDQLSAFASEVTRVAREVGTEGKLGGQAQVEGAAGVWRDLTDNVNAMASNLTGQVRDIALVTTAVANGDLSQKITVDVKGEVAELKDTINTMVDQLGAFASEVTRVAREVGTEGKLGVQARVEGVGGVWKDLTHNVNAMAGNLTVQLRDVSAVATAIADGDLTRKITVDVQGEILQIKEVINSMVDRLGIFAGEVTRVAREVGTEGVLGGQADVPNVAGTWKDLTDNVNYMAGNLTAQVRNIALVTTAVANGDLSQKITVDVKGEVLELKNTINNMVDQLRAFGSEVTRVAREVGTEGVLGGQANVPGVAGTWKDLTENVNQLAGNLTVQLRDVSAVATAIADGDLTRKITVDVRGEILQIKEVINSMVDRLRVFAGEVTRVAREVGTDGNLGGQADVPNVAGTWKDLTDSVNSMAGNLTSQVRNIADVTTAVARGDLSRKITVDVKGEILELKNTINTMVDQLGAFASEVTRVAREVGTEGVLGGQASVPGVGGTWKDLTDNVNFMAGNLTGQVRNIALVTTAVANGDLSQKITVDVKGEVLELKDTINSMVDRLSVFADEVTRMAREVGTEGKLGGQADVPNVAGTWKDLTENVNAMAHSLTAQVRAIKDVATAVTEGDLTRAITVDARGELDELKRLVNRMIDNLRETTTKNEEQDWLKTNLANFSRMMQGQKDLAAVSRLIMSELTPLVSAHHGAFFLVDQENGDEPALKLVSSYAYKQRKHVANRFELGESLVGQAALEKKPILLTNVPDDYVQINSGLGEAPPRNIIVLPILFEGEVKGAVELASFNQFSQIHQIFLDQLADSVGVVINMISANMRTEELLEQSQKLTHELQTQSAELQSQQEELRRTNVELEAQARTLKASEEALKEQQEELQQVNEELEEKASLLAEQNKKVEQKNDEVEAARLALEEKADQLALSSRYKSEFLANMSHELRTPLNSLLILAKLLSENEDGNLSGKQVEYAQTILGAGTDLLSLINDVLDLSKIESGRMDISVSEVQLADVREFVRRSFQPLAEEKGLELQVEVDEELPATIQTDSQRLQQILKNLLANAVKFTEHGHVRLQVRRAGKERGFRNDVLNAADDVVALEVIDTGIGIPKDKQRLIFEAFQQADGTTSRKYGGTGLGLSISREIARLLGGEIRVESEEDRGSRFTLFLPLAWQGPAVDARPDEDAGPESRRTTDGRRRSAYGSPMEQRPTAASPVHDDRSAIADGDRVVLIIENDVSFAKILLDMARNKGFKGIVALDGESGLEVAAEYQPDAITLDIDLPVMDGWTVLDRLKHSAGTRHIPVHIVSGMEKRQRGLQQGAISYLEKPVSKEALDSAFDRIHDFVTRPVRRLLIVEDDEAQRTALLELIGADDVEITAVANAAEALASLEETRFDCVVLDLGLADMSGFSLLEQIKDLPGGGELPIIIYTGKDLTQAEETQLKRLADTIIIKDVKSAERLLDETALFLHRVEARLPDAKRKMLERLHSTDSAFAGRKVLIVDDDVRNIFSLTSLLERHGMDVIFAENGRDALQQLEANRDVDLVLMDVMMPEMDGYETTRAIREIPELAGLPVIAVTAKAMKGDREKTIAAGASDYITKPVDTEQLMSLIRVWLYR